jgi:hypothetical protein
MTGRPSKDRVSLALVVDNIDVHTTDAYAMRRTAQRCRAWSTRARRSLRASTRNSRRASPSRCLTPRGFRHPARNIMWRASRMIAATTHQQIYEGLAPRLDRVPVDRAALRLQVAGVGVRHGPYTAVDLDAPVIVIAPGTVALTSLIAGLADRVTSGLKEVATRNDQIAQFIASYMTEQDAHNFLDKVQSKQRDGTLKTLIDDVTGDLNAIGARVTIAEETIVTDHSAFATLVTDITTNYATSDTTAAARSYTQSAATSSADAAVAIYDQGVSTSFGGLTATATGSFAAVSAINGHLAASIAWTLNVNGYLGGLKLLSDGSTVNAAFAVDHLTVGAPGYASTAVVDIGTVGGVASIIIKGSLQADGSIIARHIAVGSIDSQKIAINGVDILNIIDGAATTQTAIDFAGTSGYSGSGLTVASGSLTIKAGRRLNVFFNTPRLTVLSSPVTFSFLVDGVVQSSYIYASLANFDAPISLPIPVPSLAIGSHSFAITVSATGATASWTAGQFVIQELRR